MVASVLQILAEYSTISTSPQVGFVGISWFQKKNRDAVQRMCTMHYQIIVGHAFVVAKEVP